MEFSLFQSFIESVVFLISESPHIKQEVPEIKQEISEIKEEREDVSFQTSIKVVLLFIKSYTTFVF